MDFTTTLIVLTICVALFGLSAWRSSHRADPNRGVRLIPWTFLALIFAVFSLVVLAHFVSFFGITTGGRFS
ncbi:hypothetical protein [Woodsholea maritima]|uniref:hypothetical protein n=1 Tax=Woodsholea maritima TaxID=240237 RepID=UPI00035F710E|nr:hypothetical protein [Woodsholea maritima]